MTTFMITGARVALAGTMLLGAAAVWRTLAVDMTGGGAEAAAGSALAALAVFAAVWLILGINSRAVALMASIVHAGVVHWLTMHGTGAGMLGVLAPALAMPVLLFGGGAFALRRRGWAPLL